MSEEKRGRSGGNQPISRHPLFPIIVALWVGALFGMASLAIHPVLVERLVTAVGIDKTIPLAAPPMGATARMLIALMMTGMGAAIGALIARRVARPATKAAESRSVSVSPDESSPAETAAIAGSKRLAGRRRGLAIPAEDAPADRIAPQASQGAAILNVADFDLGSFEESSAPVEQIADAQATRDGDAVAPPAMSGDTAAPFTRTPAAGADAPRPGFDFLPHPGGLNGDDETVEAAPISGTASDDGDPRIDTVESTLPPSAPASSEHTAADRIAFAELDDLSPVELLERLALTMARRREEMKLAAAAPEAGPVTSDEPETVIESPAVESAESRVTPDIEAPVGQDGIAGAALPRLPAALRPVGLEAPAGEGEHDDDTLPGYIPPRHIGLHPATASDEEIDEDDGGTLAQGYSSLLGLSRPHPDRPTAAARPFDAPEGADPEETEKALRDALATLQRMSGAG